MWRLRYLFFIYPSYTDRTISLIRDLSLPWVAHMALLAHMEDQVHMVLQDHPDPLVLPWVHTILDHTIRAHPDHSKYSCLLFNSKNIWTWLTERWWLLIFFLQWSSCSIPASGMGQRLPTLAAGPAWSKWVFANGGIWCEKSFAIF